MSKRYPLGSIEIYQGDKGAIVEVSRTGRRPRHIKVEKLSDCAYGVLRRALVNMHHEADLYSNQLRVTAFPRRRQP